MESVSSFQLGVCMVQRLGRSLHVRESTSGGPSFHRQTTTLQNNYIAIPKRIELIVSESEHGHVDQDLTTWHLAWLWQCAAPAPSGLLVLTVSAVASSAAPRSCPTCCRQLPTDAPPNHQRGMRSDWLLPRPHTPRPSLGQAVCRATRGPPERPSAPPPTQAALGVN